LLVNVRLFNIAEFEMVLKVVLLKETFKVCYASTHVPSLELENTDICLAKVKRKVCFRITTLETTSAQLGKKP